MSNFLPDLASWALRGGAGDETNENDNDAEGGDDNAAESSSPDVLTDEQVRARRLARMEALAAATSSTSQEEEAQPMEVDVPSITTSSTTTSDPQPMETTTTTTPTTTPPRKPSNNNKNNNSFTPTRSNNTNVEPNKKAKSSSPLSSPLDPTKKLARKKEALLKKVLQVTLHPKRDPSCVTIELDDTTVPIGTQTIAEILATRLSLETTDTLPPQKPLLPYLAMAYRQAAEELRNCTSQHQHQQQSESLQELLQEIQRQVVSYAASILAEPDLFAQGHNGTEQLTQALLVGSSVDPTQSLTFGLAGPSTSFYSRLCEELSLLDPHDDVLGRVLREVAQSLLEQLQSCEHIEATTANGATPLSLVTALTAVASTKAAAVCLTSWDRFLVPRPDSPRASEEIVPPQPQQGNPLLRLLAGNAMEPAYRRRSGPGIEKQTLLGLVLRAGSAPKSNPAFNPSTILRQSLDAVERTTSGQRTALQVYQQACHALIMNLIKGGKESRTQVLQWLQDALVVNEGATALRPNTAKVSSSGMLLNVQIVLLKLCEPFVRDDTKHGLIDPGFVNFDKELFPKRGDHALPRLAASEEEDDTATSYNPKNSFIPTCFFYAARSLALASVPQYHQHENLLRHISHQHYELTSNGSSRDLQSDPQFCMLVARQRSNEVALFQPSVVVDALAFCNLMAKVLVELPREQLGQMPEFLVDTVCDSLVSVAKLKAKLLNGLELRHVFQLVVKLLSPEFASMVRNYNLRAMLGDVLYELYLPTTSGDRRDVPASIACDPLAGGQTYLLSDRHSQESLAPSLLLLYGEVEHTGYYDKMSHRAKISSLLKYLWESAEHRPAFRAITQNKDSFIKFANGIINETNTLIATVMQKLPEIKTAQEQMQNAPEWGRLSEEEQSIVTSRLEDNEREVRHALPLCNKTLQMFGYLNTDKDIRSLFLLDELCPRLVNMLIHVLGKLVGSKGLDLKVNNPEQYEFRPKEMLRDLCAIFALFASYPEFQMECAKSGCDPNMLRSASKTVQRLNLLTGESMVAFDSLSDLVEEASRKVQQDEALLQDAPEAFLDAIMATFMHDPVKLPSGNFVDRTTITQHLLNDPIDPFNRVSMTIDDIEPATELKAQIEAWLEEKKRATRGSG